MIFDMLNAEGAEVMAGGGALQSSAAWARMIADAFDTPIHLLAEAEITARGVALMMRHSLDGVPLDADPPKAGIVFKPEQDRVRLLRSGARTANRALSASLHLTGLTIKQFGETRHIVCGVVAAADQEHQLVVRPQTTL